MFSFARVVGEFNYILWLPAREIGFRVPDHGTSETDIINKNALISRKNYAGACYVIDYTLVSFES